MWQDNQARQKAVDFNYDESTKYTNDSLIQNSKHYQLLLICVCTTLGFCVPTTFTCHVPPDCVCHMPMAAVFVSGREDL